MSVKKTSGNSPKKPKIIPIWWVYILLGVMLISWNIAERFQQPSAIDKTEFYKLFAQGDIEKIVFVTEGEYSFCEAYVYDSLLQEKPHIKKLKSGGHYRFDLFDGADVKNKIEEIKKTDPEKWKYFEIDDRNQMPSAWDGIIGYILFIALMVGVWMFMMKRMGGGGGAGGQLFNIGKSKAKLFEKNIDVDISFEDVAGLEEAKVEIMEIVDFLKNPKKYTVLGAKIPKGALLVGPPGTGKTLIAKAVAGEAKVPFFSLSGSDFVEMFVGVGASRVRDLFKQAKEKAPCIIFIDEIDAIGRARGQNPSQNSNDERENTLNQLLTEMDGFGDNSGVIIMAATNRAEILDKALLRPGRFDRQIYVDMPDLNERKEIFDVHLSRLKLDDSIDVKFLAKQTPGFSGADIANICNEAALIAARAEKESVTKDDFLAAVDRIIGGLEKKNKIIKPEEKKTIAYHEAGHATVSWMMEYASPLIKVTIVPRGKSLGAAWYLPEERQITTKNQMFHEMCATLGGRAAEEIMFGEISTGALSDLEKVTKQAQAIVTIYGLNERIGNVSYYDSTGRGEYSFGKPYSERTAQIIDEEISKVIEEAYVVAKNVLIENKDKLTTLAEELLEKEVIFNEDLVKIFGIKPGNDIPEPETKKVEVAEIETTEETKVLSESEIVIESEVEDETPTSKIEEPKTEENNA